MMTRALLVLLIVAGVLASFLLFAGLMTWAWSVVMVGAFHAPRLTYWQMVAALFLVNSLVLLLKQAASVRIGREQ